MQLCAHLGEPSPTRLVEERLSWLDLNLWQEYARQHPFGEAREDLRIGIQTASLVNCHIPKGKPKAKIEDFMLKDLIKVPERKQSWQEMLLVVQAMALAGDPRESRATPEGID